MEKISEHITLAEATFSATGSQLGIKNVPTAEEKQVMKVTAEKVFEPIRKHFGVPIKILSFYRNRQTNTAVGGSSTSQHLEGKAIDMTGVPYGVDNSEIFEYILVNLKFDQLIWEFGTNEEPAWVHVSYNPGKNRMQVLKAIKKNGKTQYLRM